MGTHPIFESDFDCLTDMAFSKTPRVLITDELSRPGVPGPCDYDPNDASEKRIKGFSIREEDMKKERRQSSGKINYLTKKDTTHIQSKLARSSSVTIPRKQLKGLEKELVTLKESLSATQEASRVTIEEKEKIIQNLESKLAESHHRTDNLGRLNDEQKVEIEFCKTSQAALNQKVKNVLNQVKQMENDLSESDKLRKLQEETLSRIRLECSNVEAKNIEKDKTIEEFKEGTTNLKNHLEELEIKLESELKEKCEKMTEITKLENEIDSTNQILERTELALDSKSSELKICMAQVEVLESTNQTLTQNVQDQDSKIQNLKNDLENEKNLTKQKKSEILEITSQTKKMKSDFEEKVTRLDLENEVKSGEIKKLELDTTA